MPAVRLVRLPDGSYVDPGEVAHLRTAPGDPDVLFVTMKDRTIIRLVGATPDSVYALFAAAGRCCRRNPARPRPPGPRAEDAQGTPPD